MRVAQNEHISILMYSPKVVDEQEPHKKDECYFIAKGYGKYTAMVRPPISPPAIYTLRKQEKGIGLWSLVMIFMHWYYSTGQKGKNNQTSNPLPREITF